MTKIEARFMKLPKCLEALIVYLCLGVAGGSIAAVIQSVVYGGATTGIFSALQSAGAVGLTAATQAAIGGAAGATAGLAKWKFSWIHITYSCSYVLTNRYI